MVPLDTPIGPFVLLVLCLVWLTWVARILADHWFGRADPAATGPAPWLLQEDLSPEADPPRSPGRVETVEPLDPRSDRLPIRGTVEALDPVGSSLVLHTDDAELKYVVLPDPAMLRGLVHGDRIWLELNVSGRPRRLRKTEPAFSDLLQQLADGDPRSSAAAAREAEAAAPPLAVSSLRRFGIQRGMGRVAG